MQLKTASAWHGSTEVTTIGQLAMTGLGRQVEEQHVTGKTCPGGMLDYLKYARH